MRIANIKGRAFVVIGDNRGIDVATASDGRFGPSLRAVFDVWEAFCDWARQIDEGAATEDFAADDIGAPSPEPRQIYAIGLNYADHASESGVEPPEEPAVFTKFVTSMTGPVTEVALPRGNVDWEVELVVVIGRRGRLIPAERAWEHIAGVTLGQDISERVLQRVGALPQFSLAKSYPGFSPTGPFLVTPDELANRDDLALGCSVNGEQMQKSRTSHMVFSITELIARLSKVTELLPGDVIFSGTPAGVGGGMKPPRFLKVGDVLVSYAEGVGEMTQTFVAS